MLIYPIGTRVRIVNVENGDRSYCEVNDHGPYHSGRIIDVTPVVRNDLGFSGTAEVRVYPTG